MKYKALVTGAIALLMPTAANAVPQPIDLVLAVERAEAASKGQVIEVGLERGGSKLIYKIDVVHGRSLREVRLDASNGRIIRNAPQRIEGLIWRVYGNGAKGLVGARPLSAILRELEARSSGKIIDVEFDIEGGQARYEVELSTDAGIAGLYIDPQTGKRLDFVIED